MIPFASELKEELAMRRAVESAADAAPNPDAAEAHAMVLLDQVAFEIERARRERRSIRTSVEIPLCLQSKHNASLAQLRSFLVARGYAITVNNDTVTVSWA